MPYALSELTVILPYWCDVKPLVKLYALSEWTLRACPCLIIKHILIADEDLAIMSPTFSPQKLKFPKHVHSQMDDKFKELADAILTRNLEGSEMYNDSSAPYEVSEYPIQENEDRNYFERQYSTMRYMLGWVKYRLTRL